MRITDIKNIAETYFTLGIIAAALSAAVFCFGYFVIYRQLLHKTSAFPIKKAAAAMVMLCYLTIVLGATLFGRLSRYDPQAKIDFRPFIAYRSAWNSFSIQEWRNIILNICMFLPFGFLLPICGRWWRHALHTYLTGFVFTLAIELAQRVLRRGIFELDDLFNNLLGTMIGYGLYALCAQVFRQSGTKKQPPLHILLLQFPLFFTVMLFGSIFGIYYRQEFGNLSETYISRADLSDTDLRLNTDLSAETSVVPVYRMPVLNTDQTHEMAQALLSKLSTEIDEDQNDIYDKTAIYYDPQRVYSICIDYDGGILQFTDFSESFSDAGSTIAGKSGCSRSEIQKALGLFGVQIPEHAEFTDSGDGHYIFETDVTEKDRLCQGTVSCTYNEHDKICSFRNAMITYDAYCEKEILSEQDAFMRLQEGYFRADYFIDEIASIQIHTVSLQYRADSKGFYQPVYAFTGTVNEVDAAICIPALK